MNNTVFTVMSTILIGLGATLTVDLWGLFLQYAFKITPSNVCLIGRWLWYMSTGIYKHPSIAAAKPKSLECTLGWIAHYLTGIMFAIIFIAFIGNKWLQHPILIPAITFGMVTVAAPFLIMQPAFGLGVAASKTSHPWQARVRSLVNHIVFGIGIYLFGLAINWFLYILA